MRTDVCIIYASGRENNGIQNLFAFVHWICALERLQVFDQVCLSVRTQFPRGQSERLFHTKANKVKPIRMRMSDRSVQNVARQLRRRMRSRVRQLLERC